MSDSPEEKQIHKAEELINETGKVLHEVTSFFPLQIFPDKVTVDHNKIDIVYKFFFWEKRVYTIFHEDLTTVKISTGPFFATLYFEVRGYERNPKPIRNLPKSDAVTMYRIIMGLNKALKKGIKIQEIPIEKSRELFQEIGSNDERITSSV